MKQKLTERKTRKTAPTEVEVSIKQGWTKFIIVQQEKQNSKATLDFYKRFYKKYLSYLETVGETDDISVGWLLQDGKQLEFIQSMGEVSQQTVNAYLRGYRAFGNFCVERGLLPSFSCPIKEVEPEAKQVYTDAELKKLLKKPDVRDFEQFRIFAIINLLLSTGARSNTILNMKVSDVDLEDGYAVFNTTKAHKVVIIGLERKAKAVLKEYITHWRTEETREDDFLFCNSYGEQWSRAGLSHALARYNQKRGVQKTSIHLFRHTFAKNWIMSGGDIITLAKVLTHSELSMVQRYSNLYGTDVIEKIEQHSTLAKMKTTSGQTIKKR